ncbi:Acetyltransferase (GNAT) family protein [Evansella caseinilytica]|uniref:Acetyltransferase (GNAT) family protein n=1 Tax=Evansella caseinilytica TaxID=1503961 RepID=A0A1H3HBB2_9BACI|nr:GNAT family N-acetyltransferase [Evansella caseinilytica]SDY12158.1 Acetyltransferase (GNAT) family protein [Evansella caseinilytica]
MLTTVKIEQLSSVEYCLDGLSELLSKVVNDGASIGFLPPINDSDAAAYWKSTLAPDVLLFAAKVNQQIAGSVQLHLCAKQNGRHRAEIAKLMVHPDFRRQGIARLLMQQAEEKAVQEGRSLLVLDTREGDPSNRLYASTGYIQAGRIPDFAESATGEYDATIFYYKCLFKKNAF